MTYNLFLMLLMTHTRIVRILQAHRELVQSRAIALRKIAWLYIVQFKLSYVDTRRCREAHRRSSPAPSASVDSYDHPHSNPLRVHRIRSVISKTDPLTIGCFDSERGGNAVIIPGSFDPWLWLSDGLL